MGHKYSYPKYEGVCKPAYDLLTKSHDPLLGLREVPVAWRFNGVWVLAFGFGFEVGVQGQAIDSSRVSLT